MMRSLVGMMALVVLASVINCDAVIPAFVKKDIPRAVSKIINSTPTLDGRYTFAQVSLQLPDYPADEDAHQCGGALIAPDMVLTAAHCSQWFSVVNFDRYDFDNPDDSYFKRAVDSIAVHPLYEEASFRYDFSVVKMNESLSYVTPIPLNSDPAVPAAGEALTVLGWGATESDATGIVYPSVFQKGKVISMSNEVCAATVIGGQALYEGEIYDEMLCAQAPGVDACSGDSGGPLIIEGSSEGLDVQVGLVSWGRGCNVYPGVYSRISMGYDWIREQVCYKSVDPPSYMQCQDTERDPMYALLDQSGKVSNLTGTTSLPSASPQSTPPTRAPSVATQIKNTVSPSVVGTTRAPGQVRTTTIAPVQVAPSTQAPVSEQTATPNRPDNVEGKSSVAAAALSMRWYWSAALLGSAVCVFF